MNQPFIGITPSPLAPRPDQHGAFCHAQYSQAVERAGGVPLILPLTRRKTVLERFLSLCHGFLLSGGGDFTEASGAYGRKLTETERRTLSGSDATRDAMELFLARELLRRDIPTLGICRGLQAMNVALGGTLAPDIPNHRQVTHRIAWTKPLYRFRQVNSTHHQALERVAPALEVVARAEDGVIEAARAPSARFFVGVQFHPERLPRCDALFSALVTAARATAR